MSEQVPSNTLSSPRSALWRHMHDEHGLTLLESELDEIELLAKACSSDEPEAGCGACDKPGEHCARPYGICDRAIGLSKRASQPPGPVQVQALIDAAIQWRKGPPNYYATNQALRDAVDAYSGSTKPGEQA